MKKILLTVFLFMDVLLCSAQLEWSTKDYCAFDESNGYVWNLPWDKKHTWTKQQGLENHTVFRAYQQQTGIVAFLNFRPFTKKPNYKSILDIYDQMEAVFAYQDKVMASKGVVISDRETSPSMLNKEPAIRVYYVSKELKGGKTIKTHCLGYHLIGKMGNYIVTAKCSSAAYAKYGTAYLEGILKGFILLTENE